MSISFFYYFFENVKEKITKKKNKKTNKTNKTNKTTNKTANKTTNKTKTNKTNKNGTKNFYPTLRQIFNPYKEKQNNAIFILLFYRQKTPIKVIMGLYLCTYKVLSYLLC